MLKRVLTFQKIKRVILIGCVLDSDACQAIAESPSVESLTLMHCELRDDGFAKLLKHPDLRSVKFSFCEVNELSLTNIPGSISLETIECNETQVGHEFAAFIGRSRKLKPSGLHIPVSTMNSSGDWIASIACEAGISWVCDHR